jgi:hypothetical protein
MTSRHVATSHLDDGSMARLPWARGGSREAIRDFVAAVIVHQTGYPPHRYKSRLALRVRAEAKRLRQYVLALEAVD